MDKKDILELIDRLDSSSLAEIIIRNGDTVVKLRKSRPSAFQGPMPGPMAFMNAMPGQIPAAMPASIPVTASATAAEASKTVVTATSGEIVQAPLVGTFYRAPAPDAPSFCKEGDKVKKGQTLCIIEAMKVMNQLEAEFDCEILRSLAANGEMVEFGAPLFEVKRV